MLSLYCLFFVFCCVVLRCTVIVSSSCVLLSFGVMHVTCFVSYFPFWKVMYVLCHITIFYSRVLLPCLMPIAQPILARHGEVVDVVILNKLTPHREEHTAPGIPSRELEKLPHNCIPEESIRETRQETNTALQASPSQRVYTHIYIYIYKYTQPALPALASHLYKRRNC